AQLLPTAVESGRNRVQCTGEFLGFHGFQQWHDIGEDRLQFDRGIAAVLGDHVTCFDVPRVGLIRYTQRYVSLPEECLRQDQRTHIRRDLTDPVRLQVQ